MDFTKYEQLRYCRVKRGTKKPFEIDWTNKPYTFEEIQKYLPDENYGVLCGYGNLAVIDSDTIELQLAVESLLPETFRVKTGGGGTHNYFFIPELKERIVLESQFQGTSKHWGEVQSKGQQVVGPGSIHPSGNKYEALNSNEIVPISLQQLMSVIMPFTKTTDEVETAHKTESKTYDSSIDDLSVIDIWGIAGLKNNKHGEYFGEHPIHGSDGGMNFWVNGSKNVWHCFRCDSGGGPLSAIAVKEGLINCNQAKAGYIRGDLARRAIDLAKERYGLKSQPKEFIEPKKEEPEQNLRSIKKLELWTYKDFEKLKKEKNFVVDQVIYPKTVCMLYSPPGQFKSLLSLSMAMCVAKGKPWLGFKSKKLPVLYCDKENNDQILKVRLAHLYSGMNMKRKKFPLFILRREGDLLNDKFLYLLDKAIEDNKIKVVFFDTLHRFADYDENKSDDINRIYIKVFQPLIEKYGISIIFLHHTKKDGGYRGSGDFLGFVDTSYAVYREGKTNKFQIINEKSRVGEIGNIIGEIDFGENFINIIRKNEIDEQDKSLGKLKELTYKIKECFKPGIKIKRKDVEVMLSMADFNFSIATLKRSLKWLVDIGFIDNDGKGNYSLIET